MRRKCKHQWGLIERRFTPPRTDLRTITGADAETMMAVNFGFTTVIQRCYECGRQRYCTVPGDASRVTWLDTVSRKA